MARVAKGDGQAFDMLVRRHLPRAFAIAQRVLANSADAEEASQDAFTKIWVRACDFDAKRAKFTTWLYRIVVNTALDLARKRQPGMVADAEGVLSTIADTTPNMESTLIASQEEEAVREAVAALTPQQRAAVTLCYFEHHTNPEAARIMGLHVKALEGLLVRARRTLRDVLAPRMKGDRYAA